jgi:two-component system C4-dicarboxylate transport response regulator DctD
MTVQILLIEDDDALRTSLAQTMELEGLSVMPAQNFVQARRSIRANFAGVILSDIRMPHQDGFDVLVTARNADPELPVILMTGHSDVPTAMRAMKAGAYDYLEKPCSTDRLLEVLRRALTHRALVLKSRRIERALLKSDAAALSFPGSSEVSANLRRALRQVAATSNHVHLHGPPGTGKKLAAAAINEVAPEPRQFLRLNLRFARKDALRTLRVAEGPADLSLKNLELADETQQADLVDLLSRHPDLRLISSSVTPLPEMRPGILGEDFSLAGDMIQIRIPDLAERASDLAEIFQHLVRVAVRSLDADMPEIPDRLFAEIAARSWPGNLPELRAYAMAFVLGNQVQTHLAPNQTLAEQMDSFERLVLTETLRKTGGSAAEAARSLGLPRNTFYDRLARHGISAKDFR